MKKLIPLFVIGGALAVYAYVNQAGAFANNLIVKFKGIGLDWENTKKSLFTKVYTNLRLELANPTKFAANITSLNLKIFYQGREIGKIEKFGNLEIKPEAAANIDVSAALTTLQLFPTISAAITALGANKPINVNIKGVVNSSAGSYQFNENASLI